MGDVHPDTRPRTARRTLLLALLALCISLLLAGPAGAGPLTGGFSPTIVGGGADVDGNGIVGKRRRERLLRGHEHHQWNARLRRLGGRRQRRRSRRRGDHGADECSLVGYDGTPDGVTIEVVNGSFQVGNGPLPTVFNASDPDNPSVFDSDFAWSARDGRVDSNGNEAIDSDDCHVGVVDSIDVLSNDVGNSNPCGFASSPNTAERPAGLQ